MDARLLGIMLAAAVICAGAAHLAARGRLVLAVAAIVLAGVVLVFDAVTP